LKWDYFISHASEDKILIAEPLAHILKNAGFDIWYDDFTLKLGDPLLSTIDKGLQQSHYGIVILSPSFFAKQWTQRELAGLLAREISGKKVILPVWHQLTSKDIAKRSLILADRKGVETTQGLQSVAEQILRATYPDRVSKLPLTNFMDSNSATSNSIRKTFAELLENSPSPQDIRVFITAYHSLLHNIVGYSPLVIPAYKLSSPVPFDFALVVPHGISGPVEVQFIVLGPVSNANPSEQNEPVKQLLLQIETELGPKVQFDRKPANNYLGSPYIGEYPPLADAMKKLIMLDGLRSRNIHWKQPEVWSFKFLVIMGRRALQVADQRDSYMKLINYKLELASYDRLLDK
jgi:TIR domain